MKVQDYTSEVWDIIDELNEIKKEDPDQFIFSDIIDGNGNYYVDLVQEGGGILGIALVGYTYVLEQMGIRFVSLAGTSAGSINTILMAACGKPHEPKSEIILKELCDKNFSEFVDGGYDARMLAEALVNKNKLQLGWSLVLNSKEFIHDMGLNPGNKFYEWIEDILKRNHIENMEELERKMNDFPIELKVKHEMQATLAIIAADITTGTKAVFPKMADLYFNEVKKINPSKFVRASMSIPIFFEPFTVDITTMPRNDSGFRRKWKEKACFEGILPEQILFVDGGLMSNFPIDVFHNNNKIPTHPTFGVKLGLDRRKASDIKGIKSLFSACFDHARNIRDFEFLEKNLDYKNLISYIDIGNHNWLNFNISDKDKIDLFKKGAQTAAAFIKKFDWIKYKNVRTRLLAENKDEIMRGLSSSESSLLREIEITKADAA